MSLAQATQRLRADVTPADGWTVDPVRVLARVREVLEAMPRQDASTYPLLELFCNLMVHTKVTRNPRAHDLLRRVHTVVVDWLDATPQGDPTLDTRHLGELSTAVNSVLSVARLRQECVGLCNTHAVPHAWCSSASRWRALLPELMGELLNKPLGFPAAAFYDGAGAAPPDPTPDPDYKPGVKQQYEHLAHRPILGHPNVVLSQVHIGQVAGDDRAYWIFEFLGKGNTNLSRLAIPIRADEEPSAFASP